MDAAINDPAFATAMAERLDRDVRSGTGTALPASAR